MEASTATDRDRSGGLPAPDKDILISEVINLRRIVSDLNDQREDDRRSILILQSQIDSMRDVKCSDSFEASLKNAAMVAATLWNQIPSFPLRSVLESLKRKKHKKSGKVQAKLPANTKSLNSARSTSSKGAGTSKPVFEVASALPRDI